MNTSDLAYGDADGRHYVGYFATPERPAGAAVLLAHNAPGVDDFEREVAHRLAGLGYIGLCADFVGDGEVLSMNAVHSRLGSAIAETTLLRPSVTAGFRALLAQPSVDAARSAPPRASSSAAAPPRQ